MKHLSYPKTKTLISTLSATAVIATSALVSFSASAAGPAQVTYRGTPVTTAVPNRPVNVNFRVKNTGPVAHQNVRVTFHVPIGVVHTSVAPDNAEIIDNTISWYNVPLEPGQTFNPTLTLMVEKGTPLNIRKKIRVEIMGDGMDPTNADFALTPVAKRTTASPASKVSNKQDSTTHVSSLFQTVYDRLPTTSEQAYWLDRRSDKPSLHHLLGAMQFHHLFRLQH